MKVLLLAAGLGTRLKPLTDFTPKCLMPIKGRPLLDILLGQLSQAGLGPFLINTHYLNNQVEEYISNSIYREKVTLVNESSLLGTAGTLRANLSFFEDKEGVLLHADNYCLQDFSEFLFAHRQRPSNCIMTMMTFRTDKPSSCGVVEVDADGVVKGFYEKVHNPPGNLANGAIYILASEFYDFFETECQGATDFSTEVIPKMLGMIFSFETKQQLVDIGSKESYKSVNL